MDSSDEREQDGGHPGKALIEHPGLEEDSDPHTAEIRRNIARARQQISENLGEIQHSVEETLDWRGWVHDHPWTTVGVAFGVGFYLGFR